MGSVGAEEDTDPEMKGLGASWTDEERTWVGRLIDSREDGRGCDCPLILDRIGRGMELEDERGFEFDLRLYVMH